MQKIAIITDSASDIPLEVIKEKNIKNKKIPNKI